MKPLLPHVDVSIGELADALVEKLSDAGLILDTLLADGAPL